MECCDNIFALYYFTNYEEPTGNLDSHTAMEVVGLLKLTCREFNQTIILVTHDREVASMADQILHLKDGRLDHIEKRRENYVY